MSSNGDIFHMRETDAERILKTDLSHTLYEYNRLPAAVLVYGEESADSILPSGGEWFLRKPDDVFHASTIPNITAESNSARIFQGRQSLLDIRFDPEPDILLIEVSDGKEIAFSGVLGNFNNDNFSRDEMRDLQIVLNAEWWEKDDTDFHGNAVYVLDAKYFVPARFNWPRDEAAQGEIIAVTAHNMSESENLTVATDMGAGLDINFGTIRTNKIALIPIGIDFETGRYHLTVQSDISEPQEPRFITVTERARQSINMGAQDHFVAAHLTAAALDSRRERYNHILAVASTSGADHWTERFIAPSDGRLLIEYGCRVTVNLGHAQTYNGVKIEVTAGESIKAANGGRVVWAGNIDYDGNTVVIDHGMGIKTWYGHLATIDVSAGDGVLKGQQIGTGGRTGMITGISMNYLFFGVSVGNVFVDPMPVIRDGIPGAEAVTSTHGFGGFEGFEGFDAPDEAVNGDPEESVESVESAEPEE